MLCREDEFIYKVIFIINVVVVPISMYENLFLLLKKNSVMYDNFLRSENVTYPDKST